LGSQPGAVPNEATGTDRGVMKLLAPRSLGIASKRSEKTSPALSLLGVARLLAPEAARVQPTLSMSTRSWAMLCSTSLFESWVISWPPGGSIQFHDHGRSSGAVQVVSGTLDETRVVQLRHGFYSWRTSLLGPGDSSEIRAGCIHDIVNTSDTPATSVHVYSPRLRSMTYYRFDDGALEKTETVRYDS
jgi:uncharacterized RmlC-like cupin family protein